MNIFKDFILARPVKTPLEFGHNENIFIEAIDFNDRKRNGIKVNANTFIRLTKIDTKTKVPIASTEINFWDLDPTRDFIYDNFISQFSILSGVIDAVGGDIEKYEDHVLSIVSGDNDNEMLSWLKKPNNAKDAQNALISGFKAQMEDKIGNQSKLLKCKMVSNKKGFLQPANDIMWILPLDSTEKLPIITSREKTTYKKGLMAERKAKPDSTGEAPKTAAPEQQVSSSRLDSI